jgi:cell division transport system permease protein
MVSKVAAGRVAEGGGIRVPRLGAARLLRPAGFDDLGLRRALGDRMLPLLVAAMAFLGALALGGSVGAAAIGRHWQSGAASVLTVQIPRPGAPAAEQGAPAAAGAEANRRDRVVALLAGTPGIVSARALSDSELADLLRPWLGAGAGQLSLPLPGVVEVHMADPAPDLAPIAARIEAAAPGTVIESHDLWVQRLATLARSLQACAWAVLALVAGVAAAVIMVATRAGLVARREAIEIVHALGATDGYIAGRFARRASGLAAAGGLIGAAAALPVLLGLAGLAAPFAGLQTVPTPDPAAGAVVARALAAFPPPLWVALPALPVIASLIGFVTAHATVRSWLRRLP